jgi:hypothetical protein
VERLERLGDRLDAIDQALQTARQETQPQRREKLLDLVGRAVTAARTEHQAAEEEQHRRPVFRVIQGGAVAALIAGIGAGMRTYWLRHRPQFPAAAAAVTAAAALLYFALEGGPGTHHDAERPAPAPTVTVTHTEPVAEPHQVPEPGLTTAPVLPADEAEPTAEQTPAAQPAEPLVTDSEPTIWDSPAVEPRRRGRATDPEAPPGPGRDGEKDGQKDDDGTCVYASASPPGAEAEACLRT